MARQRRQPHALAGDPLSRTDCRGGAIWTWENLDGDGAILPGVPGTINLAHTSGPENSTVKAAQRSEHYQMITRFSGGTNILSPSLTPNAA